MSDFNTNRISNNHRARRVVQAGAIALAVCGGYALRDMNVVAQNGTASTAPPTQKAPVVATAATRDAASTQGAFAEVSEAVEPAVVTIRNAGSRGAAGSRTAPGGRNPRLRPFGPGPGGNQDQNVPEGADPFNGGDLQQFFKQFQRQFGFNEQSFNSDSLQGRVLRDRWADAKAKFIQQEGGRSGGGLGSGMIYRADGLIITNAHVVKGASTVAVTLSDGRTFEKAKVLGRDERTDIAVVKIEATNLPTVKLGDSDTTKSGDWAIAVGNPFGLDHTLTVGVISATKRNGSALRLGGEDTRTDYLQTDASINPGNSGGPLLNINGVVVGVNNAIYSESGGNQGIGFAIPVNTARFVADRIVKEGKVRRSYLGVKISNIDDNALAFGLDPKLKGVLIQEVSDPGAPGAKAGLQAGDVVTQINGKSVSTSSELQTLVGNSEVGSTANLTVVREGRTINLSAKLDELKDETPERAAAPAAPAPDVTRGQTSVIPGLKLRNLTPEVARALGIEVTRGVAVTEVTPDSPADNAGLQRGDMIERVASTLVTGVAEFGTAVGTIIGRQTGEGKKVAIYINRGGQRSYVIVTVN